MSTIKSTDTPAIIAGKWLGGHLPGVSATDAMLEIRKRAAAMENRIEDARAAPVMRGKLRAVA